MALLLTCATPLRAQTYEPVLIPPQINGAPTTMTPLNLGDDATRRVSLGFEFEYWGQTFTEAWVSSNGFVSFESAAHLCCNGEPIEQAQRNTIYAYWSDLISRTGNPYYSRADGSILFGWYGTNEYGTNNSNTFEIGLFSDGKIQLNYGGLGSTGGHTFTAGITGPNASDNIELFYGRDTRFFQNQSGILAWVTPEPEVVAVDCRTTPAHPSCPPANVEVLPDPVAAVAAAVEQSADITPEEMEQVVETATVALERADEVVAAAALEQAEEATVAVEEAAPADEPADNAETATSEADMAERLNPDQVAALAATGSDAVERTETEQVAALAAANADTAERLEQYQDIALTSFGSDVTEQSGQAPAMAASTSDFGSAQSQDGDIQETQDGASSGASATQARFDSAFGGSFGGPFGQGPSMSASQSASPLDMAISAGSPMSVANTFEALGLGSPAAAPSGGNAPQPDSGMSEGQGDTISAMGAVPGFAAYTQASLQDRADFYAIRDIYSRRRLRDANFELYRMMQTNDARWQEMVDEQYR